MVGAEKPILEASLLKFENIENLKCLVSLCITLVNLSNAWVTVKIGTLYTYLRKLGKQIGIYNHILISINVNINS